MIGITCHAIGLRYDPHRSMDVFKLMRIGLRCYDDALPLPIL